MKQNGDCNMVNGVPIKVILLFALPIFFGNIFQQLYNVVDTAILGNVVGDQALASVGATAAIYGLVIGFANGMTNGFSVVLARFYGAGKKEEMKKTVALTVALTVMISVILTVIALCFLYPLLKSLKTPDSLINGSYTYLSIILQFSVVTMLYNMYAGMLRAIGNSKMPLVFLILSTVVNIVLDLIFIKGFSLGIPGAAYATVIAIVVSVIFCVVYIRKNCPLLKFKREYLVFDKKLIIELLTTGLSMGLMIAIVQIGSVALQSAVNSLGDDIIAAHTIARRLDDIFMTPLGTLTLAASTFASQNFGAGRNDRVKQGIKDSILLAFIWSGISCAAVWIGGRFMAQALSGTTNQHVINTTVMYIKINIPFFFILSILLILRSSLQGIGKKIVPLSASMIELLAKFLAVGVITPLLGYLGVCILEPIIWVICAILVSVDFIVYMKRNMN